LEYFRARFLSSPTFGDAKALLNIPKEQTDTHKKENCEPTLINRSDSGLPSGREESMSEWEPTNAPLLVIETEYGFVGIDPFDETYVEASKVAHLWEGRTDIQALHSQSVEGSLMFVSLDWLIKIHPDKEWLSTLAAAIKKRIRADGFEADED
jgi:hypothetical protein